MRKLQILSTIIVVGGSMMLGYAQTTQPVLPARDVLNDMLRPNPASSARPLQPSAGQPLVDKSSGAGAVAPDAPIVKVLPEGSYIVDRVGRLTKTPNSQGWEFNFESDGKALKDPPLVVLPNRNLMLMEDLLKETNRDLKFRITGMVTDYRGRNHVLFVKAVAEHE